MSSNRGPNRNRAILAGVLVLVGVLTVWLVFQLGSPPELRRSELELRDGILYPIGGDKPFTGILYDNFPLPAGPTVNEPIASEEPARKLEIRIRDGKAHGRSVGFFENGRLEVEEFFVEGVSHGIRTRWYENGQKKSEEEIVQGELSGDYIEWHENGARALRMKLVRGKAEGVAEAWNPDGALKSRTEFSGGEIVGQEFFSSEAASGR